MNTCIKSSLLIFRYHHLRMDYRGNEILREIQFSPRTLVHHGESCGGQTEVSVFLKSDQRSSEVRAEAERLLRSPERKREQKKEINDEVGCSSTDRPVGRQASKPGVSRRVRKYVAAVCSLSICGRESVALACMHASPGELGGPRTLGHPSGLPPSLHRPRFPRRVPPGNVRAPPSGWLYY